jgi:hypothetical protein
MKSSREKYQEALVLLQDPLLPVRAQGLATLRHLLEPTRDSKASPVSVDAALIPAILDIFTNSAQNEDSFIFLNAVKGLAAMVHRFGKDVFRRLLDTYVTEPGLAGSMNRQELDIKLRIGEALGEVIGSSGQSLGGYGMLRSLPDLPSVTKISLMFHSRHLDACYTRYDPRAVAADHFAHLCNFIGVPMCRNCTPRYAQI